MAEEPNAVDVFVSYASEDRETVRAIVTDIEGTTSAMDTKKTTKEKGPKPMSATKGRSSTKAMSWASGTVKMKNGLPVTSQLSGR